MNHLNERCRIMRTTIEYIDKILATEQVSYRKGVELKKKRDDYVKSLQKTIKQLNGVD